MRIALFAGSFDPITKGHEDIVQRAIPLFDKIIVAMGVNSVKKYYFSEEKRMAFLNATFANCPSVEVYSYGGLTADFCKQHKVTAILRGLRNASDFDYEYSIAHLNKHLNKDLETVFLAASPIYTCFSSTIVREILKGGKDPSPFLPEAVLPLL